VFEGSERRKFQNEALDMLEKATHLNNSDGCLFYQYALQLAEVGEVMRDLF
jgi:hypothetical protein